MGSNPKPKFSYFKVAVVVVVICAAMLLAVAWMLRQPNFGALPYPALSRADPAALENHVNFLASTDPPRYWQNSNGLDRAAQYIMEWFHKTGARCSEQNYMAGKVAARNLIARFGPETGPVVVVGAHYDVFGELPGADDNASGVAGLLELARMLGDAKLATPVELVAFSTEEPPFYNTDNMGSAVHAVSMARAGVRIRAMIALEMIGFFAPKQTDIALPLYLVYPYTGNFVSLVGRWSDRDLVRLGKKCFRGATKVPVVSYSGPAVVGSDMSDHRNYWATGVPAIMVSDTAFLRNPNYHSDFDTPATLDYKRMAGVVDGVFSMVLQLASPPASP